jgi:ribosomal protein L40E
MTTPNRPPPDELDRKIAKYAKVAIPVATVAVAGATGAIFGTATAILVLAGGALIGVIAIFWSSVRTLLGETRLAGADAYALGAPRAEEEQKRAVLRALKDLEYERSVGKISEEDYQALIAKYRAEAKRLLRVLDEGTETHREQVESLVAKRFRREGLSNEDGAHPYRQPEQTAPQTAPTEPAERKKKGKKRGSTEAHAPDKRVCQACQTPNDVDAVFCKKCGARQLPEPRATDEAPEDQNTDQEAGP